MTIDVAPDEIAAIVGWAAMEPLVVRVYVFGSRAKGTARPDSDLDLAAVIDDAPGLTNKRTWNQRWLEWLGEVDVLTPLPIDLLRLHSENPDTSRYVAEHGVLVYERPSAQSESGCQIFSSRRRARSAKEKGTLWYSGTLAYSAGLSARLPLAAPPAGIVRQQSCRYQERCEGA